MSQFMEFQQYRISRHILAIHQSRLFTLNQQCETIKKYEHLFIDITPFIAKLLHEQEMLYYYVDCLEVFIKDFEANNIF